MSLDLSFYRRGELSRRPIVLKDASTIMSRTQDRATLILVALFVGLATYLIWGVR